MASKEPFTRKLQWRWWAAYPALIVPVIAMTMHWGWRSLVLWIAFMVLSARLKDVRDAK